MNRALTLTAACLVPLAVGFSSVNAQTWDPNKVYSAEVGGSPNTLRYIDNNGAGFLGWAINDTAGAITNTAPISMPAVGGLYGNFFQVLNGKEKHLTNNWGPLNADMSTRTALFWRLYIPSTPNTPVKFPSIQIRTHGLRHHLDFSPSVAAGDGCIGFLGGWTGAEGASIVSGGRLVAGSITNERYLPMSMDKWHTIRVEVFANGDYQAWIDEDQGLTDVQHVVCKATKLGTGDYIEIGVRSTITGYSQSYTNYLAFGQDTTATGGTNQIKPVPATGMEICGNGLDDNSDGLTDCQDPGCLCDERPEICGNGVDDDCDGLADCADPDCLGVNPESTEATCSNGLDEDCDGQYDCSDADCAAVPLCGNDQPFFAMTLVRQVGDWQNCGGGCRQVYFSAYDENGTPLNEVVIKDVETGCTVTTHTDRGQDGHANFLDESPCGGVLLNTTYRFHVSTYLGLPVASDVTPDMHAWIAPHNPFHAWQVEFMLKSRKDNPVAFTPADPTYIFDSVEMNTPPGPNNTLLDDFSGIDYDGTLNAPASTMFGQTFVANGNRIVSLRAELALPPTQTLQYEASIHPLLADPPTSLADIGPAIGPAKRSPANMLQSEWWKQMILWPVDGPDSVPVEPGQKYFLKLVRTDSAAGFTAFGSKNWYDGQGMKHSGDRYPNGQRYRLAEDGVSLVMDLYPAQDKGYYDLVAYIVAATVSDDPCRFNDPVFDENGDHRVDAEDLAFFENCATGPGIAGNWADPWTYCECLDYNKDQAIDQADFAAFQRCISGAGFADETCDDN